MDFLTFSIRDPLCLFVVGDELGFLGSWLVLDEFLYKKRVEYRFCNLMSNGVLILVNWCLTLPK